jgi:hypothetical protein
LQRWPGPSRKQDRDVVDRTIEPSPATSRATARDNHRSDEPEAEPATEEEVAERQRSALAAQQRLFDEAHENERPDRDWAVDAEAAIEKTYARSDFKDLKLSADCRATLCRVDFEYSDSDSSSAALQSLTFNHPWAGQRFTRVNQETRRGASFFAREGFALPSITALEEGTPQYA